jgi:hypothetical protein
MTPVVVVCRGAFCVVIVGQGCLTIRSSDGRTFAFFETERFRPYGVATIVGHDEYAVPLMRRFDASSRNVKPHCPVSEARQLRSYKLLRHVCKASNVLDKRESGSQLGNNASHLRPPVARISDPEPFAGDAERLTGRSTGNDVDSVDADISKSDSCDLFIRFEDWFARPVPRENLPVPFIRFAKCDRFDSCEMGGVVHPSDARVHREQPYVVTSSNASERSSGQYRQKAPS